MERKSNNVNGFRLSHLDVVTALGVTRGGSLQYGKLCGEQTVRHHDFELGHQGIWGYVMSCYFRHMKDVLDEAGVEVTKENKKKIDSIIHGLVKVEYKNCSPAWKAVKENIKANEEARNRFIKRLRKALQAS